MSPLDPSGPTRALTIATGLLIALLATTQVARADVIVLANRTGSQLSVRFVPAAGMARQLKLPAGEVVPLLLDGKAHVEFASGGTAARYQLDANCAYFFGRGADGRVGLQRIGLGEDSTAAAGRSLPGSASRAPVATIPVKILVDEEEAARPALWERRLRQRVDAASAILEKHAGVRLRVVAVDTWISDNSITDFVASLTEFERKVSAAPARLTIGFTSQWPAVRGRTHMAGTRGPLHSHILVREGSPDLSEPERLEFLVHELGHHLGATHSPERGSVMRPVLGDKQALRAGFRIQFDPVNTLVIAMIGEEMRRRNVTRLSDLTSETQHRLRQIYAELARAMPNDPAGQRYVQAMRPAAAAAATSPPVRTVEGGAKQVLQAIVRAAAANHELPGPTISNPIAASRRQGDALTNYYVSAAARATVALPEDIAARAFLAALGVGLDDSKLLASLPAAGKLAGAMESPGERAARLRVLGEPTVRGRRDLAKHFFVSAYLTATMGRDAAEAAGLAKELLDAHGGSGFSFADMAANRAGIRFADGVLNKRFPLVILGQSFSVAALMPPIEGLPEGISAAEFAAQYGTKDDPRFGERIGEIDRRLQALPAYRQPILPLGR